MKKQRKEGRPKPSPDDVTIAKAGWLRGFFWGVDKEQPCVLGVQNTYVDHWLAGAHSWGKQRC